MKTNIKYTLNESKAIAIIMYLKQMCEFKYNQFKPILFVADKYSLNEFGRPVSAQIPKKLFNKYELIKMSPNMNELSKSDIESMTFGIAEWMLNKNVKVDYNYYKMLTDENKKNADDIFYESENLVF